MIWFIVIFLLILLFFLAELLIFIGVFYSPFKSQGNIHRVPKGEQYRYREDYVWQITEELAARTFEKAEIASFDGLTLFARCYEQNKKAPVMLCFHFDQGFLRRRQNDPRSGLQSHTCRSACLRKKQRSHHNFRRQGTVRLSCMDRLREFSFSRLRHYSLRSIYGSLDRAPCGGS